MAEEEVEAAAAVDMNQEGEAREEDKEEGAVTITNHARRRNTTPTTTANHKAMAEEVAEAVIRADTKEVARMIEAHIKHHRNEAVTRERNQEVAIRTIMSREEDAVEEGVEVVEDTMIERHRRHRRLRKTNSCSARRPCMRILPAKSRDGSCLRTVRAQRLRFSCLEGRIGRRASRRCA